MLDLHEDTQDAGGWTNSHIFTFRDLESGARTLDTEAGWNTIDPDSR